MKVTPSAIPDVLVIEPDCYGDERGFFMETYNQRTFAKATGLRPTFVQDNHSRSARNVLRGLHYQIAQPQSKLLRIVSGEVFDVVVDLRRWSGTFGRWVGTALSAENRLEVWIPAGCAHGFLVQSAFADVTYKATDYWAPQHERCIAWDDGDIAIDWPTDEPPILSARDAKGLPFRQAEVYEIPFAAG